MRNLASVIFWGLLTLGLAADEPLTRENWDAFFGQQVERNEFLHAPKLDFKSVRVGQIGTLSGDFRVLQKINDKESLVVEEVKEATGVINFAVRYRDVTLGPFLFRDIQQTNGLVDDSKVQFSMQDWVVVELSDTYSFTTASGAMSTVMVVEPCKRDVPSSPAFVGLETREWSDKSGKFTVTAIYAGSEKGKVSLKKEDGSVVDVPLSALSDDDIKRVRELAKKHSQYERLLKANGLRSR